MFVLFPLWKEAVHAWCSFQQGDNAAMNKTFGIETPTSPCASFTI
jgi:hypothetical protein